jgi:hypothetical protein
MRLSPAEWVIRQFGGVSLLARAIGRTPQAVSKWRASRWSQGTDGRIPGGLHEKILREAKRLELDVTVEDLVLGRDMNGDGQH